MEGLIETKNEYIEHMQDIITIPISKKTILSMKNTRELLSQVNVNIWLI